MTVTITAFERSPDQGRGLARDFRVRWALEEVGQRYDVRLLSFAAMKEPAHRRLQPFGQIPTYEADGRALFETGAIVLHIAETWPGLLPDEPAARDNAISWVFAALGTVEPPIVETTMALLFEREKSWFAERQPMLEQRVHTRLADLSAALGEADWLAGPFSAADILMVHVVRRLESSGLLDGYPTLTAYIARAAARSAYQRAFAAQKAVFENAD